MLSDRGISDGMIRSQVARGQLIRVRQGVFIAAAHWPDGAAERHIVVARAEQALHPESVISHGSAATIWGLPRPGFGAWHEESVSLTMTRGSRPHRPGARYHRWALPPTQVVRDAAGYRVTTPARTAVDLAAGLALPESLVLLDSAARLACAGFVSQVRRQDYRSPGLVVAARALLAEAADAVACRSIERAVELADPARESAIESLSAGHFQLAGLPRPRFQEPVRTPFGMFFPDCLWPEHRLIGEADGALKYAIQGAIVAEKQREQILRDQGWAFVRWLGKEIMITPEAVVERVARALDAR